MSQQTVNLHALLNEEKHPFYTIMAVFPKDYQRGDAPVAKSRPYMYKVPADCELEVGDFVVVQTGQKADLSTVKVVEVVEVHDDDQIDYNSDILVKWIVQKVDPTGYAARRKADTEALNNVKKEQRKFLKQQMVQALTADNLLSRTPSDLPVDE